MSRGLVAIRLGLTRANETVVLPLDAVFMNGPNWGRNVFVPMDAVIGGVGETYFSFWSERNEVIAQALAAAAQEGVLVKFVRSLPTDERAVICRQALGLGPDDL